MEEKSKTSEEELHEESVSFDEMEKSFNKVVQELVNDRSLDKFREEYEKLHDALVQSHDHNTVLLDKVRSLNSDIVINADKIGLVLTLSQNDQRTIAGLRTEFEKAWKMVETSQEREAKSKDVIYSLKEEIQNLTSLVSQSRDLQFVQENSLQDVVTNTKMLKRDIKTHEETIVTLKNSIKQAEEETVEMTTRLEALHKEYDDSQQSLIDMSKEQEAMTKQSEELLQSLLEKKEYIKSSQKKIEETRTVINDRGLGMSEINAELRTQNLYHRTAMDEKHSFEKKMKELQQRLEDKKNTHANRSQMRDDKSQMYHEMCDKIVEMKEKLVNTNQELEQNKIILAEMKKDRARIEEERKDQFHHLQQMRSDVIFIKSKTTDAELNIRVKRIDLEIKQKDNKELANKVDYQKLVKQTVEQECGLVERSLLNVKQLKHRDRADQNRMENETDEYNEETNIIRTNINAFNDYINEVEQELNEKNTILNDTNAEIKHQIALCEALQSERDMVCRALQTQNTENNRFTEENTSISNLVKQLKTEVKMLDQQLIDRHLTIKETIKKNEETEKAVEDLRNKLNDLNDHNLETYNQIQISVHLKYEAGVDITRQRNICTSMKRFLEYIDRCLARRNKEANILRTKAKTMEHCVTMGADHFERLIDRMEILEQEFLQHKTKQEELLHKVRHMEAAIRESRRLEKEVIRYGCYQKALEDEMEHHVNVHRWQLIDATNPELANLLHLKEALVQQLTLKISQYDRVSNQVKEIKDKSVQNTKKLHSVFNCNFDDEFNTLNKLLQQKTQQLNELEMIVHKKKPVVEGQKLQVSTVRTKIREYKYEIGESKQQINGLRLQTAGGDSKVRSPTYTPTERAPGRFVGGGFGAGSIVPSLNLQRAQSNKDKSVNIAGLLGPNSARRIHRPNNVNTAQQNGARRAYYSARGTPNV